MVGRDVVPMASASVPMVSPQGLVSIVAAMTAWQASVRSTVETTARSDGRRSDAPLLHHASRWRLSSTAMQS